MSELREHVAKVYYELRAPYETLADLEKDYPYHDNPDFLCVPVDSDIFEGRRVLHVSKDRVADALVSYADNGDRVIYPPGTVFICDALDEDGRFHEAEVLFKRPDGYWRTHHWVRHVDNRPVLAAVGSGQHIDKFEFSTEHRGA